MASMFPSRFLKISDSVHFVELLCLFDVLAIYFLWSDFKDSSILLSLQ